MAKTQLLILALLVLAFVVLAMHCAISVADRSDNNDNNGENNEGDDEEMFLKMQICSRCKTGKYMYELDPKSEICPYIGFWKKNKCHFYVPLDKTPKNDI